MEPVDTNRPVRGLGRRSGSFAGLRHLAMLCLQTDAIEAGRCRDQYRLVLDVPSGWRSPELLFLVYLAADPSAGSRPEGRPTRFRGFARHRPSRPGPSASNAASDLHGGQSILEVASEHSVLRPRLRFLPERPLAAHERRYPVRHLHRLVAMAVKVEGRLNQLPPRLAPTYMSRATAVSTASRLGCSSRASRNRAAGSQSSRQNASIRATASRSISAYSAFELCLAASFFRTPT